MDNLVAAPTAIFPRRVDQNARQGLRALRPTRPAGRGLHSAGPPCDGSDTGQPPGLCTLARSRGKQAPGLRPGKPVGLPQGTRRAKTVFVVTVRRHVVVATGRADVRRLIVERAAPQHAACRWPPSAGRWYQTADSEGTRCPPGGRGPPSLRCGPGSRGTTRSLSRRVLHGAQPPSETHFARSAPRSVIFGLSGMVRGADPTTHSPGRSRGAAAGRVRTADRLPGERRNGPQCGL